MTRNEVIDLLSIMTAFDGMDRRSKAVIDAWCVGVGDLSFADAKVAVAAHYREEPDRWIRPAHIQQRVKEMRRERIERAGLLIGPPEELADDSQAWLNAYRLQLQDVAAGRLRPATTPDGRQVLAVPGEHRAIEGGQP